jgi:uncharacterized lipoprotein YddW (UPF0748 family)
MKTVEIRGVWLTTTDSQVFHSQQNIAAAMNLLAETGFNVVFPVVWNKAMTLYPSSTMRQTFGIEIDPAYIGRDPLAEMIVEARRVGLKIIPWFEYGFASSYNSNGGLLLAKKPEWAARDYQGNLLTKNGFEWLNALNSEVQQFLLNLILEVVKNYDVDGVQGDDRLPALPSEGGYDPGTVELYRSSFGRNPPNNFKDKQWLQWRADILTRFLALLYQEVKSVNPSLLVSMAPNIQNWAFQEYLQDTSAWMKQGLVDMIHPLIYRRDFNSYKRIIDQLVNTQFTDMTLLKLAPGILMKVGSYQISPDHLLQAIKYNRACGILGEVFFFYEGLRDNNNTLAKVLHQGPYAQPASFPSIAELNQGGERKQKSSSIWQRLLKF